MTRLALGVAALMTSLYLAAPAHAEPRQSAIGTGVVSVQLVKSGDTYTWGPWQLTGAWRADDGSSFTGTLVGQTVTTAPPTPAWVIPDFTVAGSNSGGGISGDCNGSVAQRMPRAIELSMYCLLYISGASLAADNTEMVYLAAVRQRNTSDGYVIDYRGGF